MEVRFKNFVTIPGSYTQQGLSSNITFRPIKSGATVPLSCVFELRRACARLAGLGSGARCGSAAWTAASTAAAATWPASATQVAADRASRVILLMMTALLFCLKLILIINFYGLLSKKLSMLNTTYFKKENGFQVNPYVISQKLFYKFEKTSCVVTIYTLATHK
jgi:hypothetical protein